MSGTIPSDALEGELEKLRDHDDIKAWGEKLQDDNLLCFLCRVWFRACHYRSAIPAADSRFSILGAEEILRYFGRALIVVEEREFRRRELIGLQFGSGTLQILILVCPIVVFQCYIAIQGM